MKNFGEDQSSSFGGEHSNQNFVACSRRGSAYFVEYLQMYWTDFRNLFTIWKCCTCQWWICTLFSNLSRDVAMMIGPIISAEKILIEIALGVYVVCQHISSNFSGSTGPIFTIFASCGRYWIADDQSCFPFPISLGTLLWQQFSGKKCGKIAYPLHLSLCHSKTKWDNAVYMHDYIVTLMPLYRVKIWWRLVK